MGWTQEELERRRKSKRSMIETSMCNRIVETYKELINEVDRYKDICKTVSSVYLIKNNDNGLYKIGMSKDPFKRTNDLIFQSGCDLELKSTIELRIGIDNSARSIELFLHRFFAKKRKIGEWFRLDLKDILRIVKLFDSIEGEYIYDDIYKNGSVFVW